MPKFKFYIIYQGDPVEVFPHYNNNLTAKGQRDEQKEGLFDIRKTIETTFKFVREDYDLISNDFGINEKIPFEIHRSTDNGITYIKIYDLFFTHIDCQEFDADKKIVSVKPKTTDRYTKILNNLDTEFNLIELGVATTPIKYKVVPLFQTYVAGSSVITNYLRGTYWEQQVTPVSVETDLLNIYKFGKIIDGFYVLGSGQLTPDVSGFYNDSDNTRTDGVYILELNSSPAWQIKEVSSGTVVFLAQTGASLNDAIFVNQSNSSQETIVLGNQEIYCRYLSSVQQVGNDTLDVIPANDIVPNLARYGYVKAITSAGVIISEENQTDPTFWGRFSDSGFQPSGFTGFFNGNYFVRPSTQGNITSFPVSKVNWFYNSYWLYFDSSFDVLLESATDEIEDNNAMQLHDVLSRVLEEVDSSLTFQKDIAHSDFFYSSSNPIHPSGLHPFITPKSNILIGNYDQPAQTAKIKLSEIFEMLRNCYLNYWYIDDVNRLRIEHERFYHKGGSYTTNTIDADLITELEPKTLKSWAFDSNKWKYRREAIPQEIRFNWMDAVSPPFEGYPIKLIVEALKDGTIEDKPVSRFTTDIDFAISQANDIVKEGFFLLEAEFISNEYVLPYLTVNYAPNIEYKMQNGYLALVWLIDNYHRDNLPANGIKINTLTTTATSVKRTKLQSVVYPNIDINFLNLIRTSLGEGLARAVEEDLLKSSLEIEVEHDIV